MCTRPSPKTYQWAESLTFHSFSSIWLVPHVRFIKKKLIVAVSLIMMFRYILISLHLALLSNSLSIILPLYLYPGDKAIAWSDITTTIEAYPKAQWLIVINPRSGPEGPGYPSANFIRGIAKLNSYPNVQTVGYIDTIYGNKTVAAVNRETDIYASWAHYAAADIAIGGIYFDDVSIKSGMFPYYSAVAAYARSSMHSSSVRVVFNPGYRAPAPLFSYADTIVEFEDSLANYESSAGSNSIIGQIPAEFRGKSALQVYLTPEGTEVGCLMAEMEAEGIEAVYFGVDHEYKVYSKILLQDMAEAAGG